MVRSRNLDLKAKFYTYSGIIFHSMIEFVGEITSLIHFFVLYIKLNDVRIINFWELKLIYKKKVRPVLDRDISTIIDNIISFFSLIGCITKIWVDVSNKKFCHGRITQLNFYWLKNRKKYFKMNQFYSAILSN